MGLIHILLFCDQCDEDSTRKYVSDQSKFVLTVVPLANGPKLARCVREAVCSLRSNTKLDDICAINWCTGNDEDIDRADASKVTTLLEEIYKLPLIGNPMMNARYDFEDIRMLMYYSDLPCTNFCVVKSPKHLAQLRGITLPAEFMAGGVTRGPIDTMDALTTAVSGALSEYPTILVTEATKKATHALTIIVQNGCLFQGAKLMSLQNEISKGDVDEAAISTFASTVAKTIIGKQGHARVSVHVDESGSLTLINVVFNISCPVAEAGISLLTYLESEVPLCLAKARISAPRHVVSFDTVGKGYFMRAARDIEKGEVVFEDERRAFAIVTREHVAKTWSEEDKYTFSRYAWPLDSDCHVYAIWEDDPKRWRPINHSCDPNLVFAEGHSLNVIARRAIAEGEDLTLDYSTFCDYTMKPFECFCKTSLCRGTVTPGQVPWEQYGTNSWFRKEPPQVEDLLPKGQS